MDRRWKEKERTAPGFCLQLRLILWKNLVTKKRHPIISIFELLIPLVLFIVILLIRRTQYAVPIHTEYYTAQPLLSTGVIPILQSFCPSKNEKESVYTRDNAKLKDFMGRLDTASLQIEPIISQLDTTYIPANINNTVDLLVQMTEKLTNTHDIRLEQILSNVSMVTEQLQSKYNLSSDTVEELMKSNINTNMIIDQFVKSADATTMAANSGSLFQYLLEGAVFEDMKESMCAGAMEDSVFLPSQTVGADDLKSMTSTLCQLDHNVYLDMINMLLSNVNPESLEKEIGDIGLNAENEKALLALVAAGSNLDWLDKLSPFIKSCRTATEEHTSKAKRKDERNHDIKSFWVQAQPLLCGSQDETVENSTKPERVHFNEEQKQVLELLTHLLDRGPRILYTPNNTAANRIMKEMNGTLAVLGNITTYAKQWKSLIPTRDKMLQTARQQYNSSMLQTSLFHHVDLVLSNIDKLACTWLRAVEDVNFDIFIGFETEAKLEHYFLHEQYHNNVTVLAGVVFEGLTDATTDLPRHVKYKIRQNATINPPTNQIRAPFWFPSPGSNHLFYYYFGFVWIQDAIERAIITLQSGRPIISPGTMLHRMPYPCWLWDGFVWLIQHVMPLCLMLSWVYTVAVLVQRIVYEKEKRLKEVMKIMGLNDSVHWIGWFITACLQMTVTVIILTLMLHFGRVLPYSNPWIVFIFLELFALSSIAFSFLISSIFSKAKLAAACAGIFYFITYVPYMYITIREDVKGTMIFATAKTCASLFSTTALGLGGKYFLFYEIEGTGVQWSNIAVSPREKDDFSLLHVLLMMAVDTIIYFVLAWYIEHVHPGTYGIPKPWYFPFTPSYWCGSRGNTKPSSWNFKRLLGIQRDKYTLVNSDDDESETSSNVYWCGCHSTCGCSFEKEDAKWKAGVIVSNLRKKYEKSDQKPALDGLSMKLYESQITAFLGHNGAGKTTTMGILSGLFPPTSGTATIYDRDVRTEMDIIRQDMGMCPQHNVLFDSLTVEEHIWFYSRLKGMSTTATNVEIIRMLKDLSLQKKRNSLPSTLSGGMQRKLSIAMAFVGGARTVILDEPTAGVDPHSRRAIWALLTKYKPGRTILVSTHHLDEAETLGDRIVIIAEGRVKCGGSPTYLKSTFGDGHQLYIVKAPGSHNESHTKLLNAVKELVPRAFVSQLTEKEVHLTLPVHKEERGVFVQLFNMLEESKEELGIKGYDISDSGLEQVFVKVTTGSLGARKESVPDFSRRVDMSVYDTDRNDDCELLQLSNTDDPPEIHAHRQTDCKMFTHFKAMLAKRLRYTQRNRKGLLSQIILPAVFVSISMTIALTAPKLTDPDPIVLSTSQYYEAMQPDGNFVPFSIRQRSNNKNNAIRISKINVTETEDFPIDPDTILGTFFLPSGIGVSCLLNEGRFLNKSSHIEGPKRFINTDLNKNSFISNCARFVESRKDFNFVRKHKVSNNLKYFNPCKCKSDNVGLSCDNKHASLPPQWHLLTHDVIQNITSSDEDDSDYYLYTNDRYRLHRYGGFAFHKELPFVPTKDGIPNEIRQYLDMLAVREYNEVWYNNKGYHSMPTYLNVLNNAILRAALPSNKGDPATYGITLTNHPMKRTNDFLNSDYINGGTDVLMAIFIIVAMSFVPASFVVFLVHERAVKAKHLQLSSGLHPVTYWVTNYIWDMCNYVLPGICIIGILLAFHIEAYVSHDNFQAVVWLFLIYGWSITPMMYPASFLFTEPSVAYICLIVVNLFTGITCVICSFMLKLFDFDTDLSSWGKLLNNVFLIFPNYCLGNGMMTIALNHYQNEYYERVGQYDKMKFAMNWDITGKKLVAMTIVGVVSFTFTLFCEYHFCISKSHRIKGSRSDENLENEDSDVKAERQRTLLQPNINHVLRLEGLTKVYKTWKRDTITAVKELSISIPKGECFGLLGINGAGKTTTFRMLTGDLSPSSGDVKLLSESVIKGGRWIQQNVGYCPQFDALFHELTPTEHLYLFARLRGIPSKHLRKVVQHTLTTLGLTRYKDQSSGTLSGGNKRKLSTAIALIGEPRLVILDEPTSGMDPYTRRFLWCVIQRLIRQGTSVIFSSHSMEECEALCTRLSIMVDGRLRCLGSIQHLKDKFGSGYTIHVVLESGADTRSVNNYMEQRLMDSRLKYRGQNTLVYELKVESKQLADLFAVLENIPNHMGVKDYSISQNTLDNVFIRFANGEKSVEGDSVNDANRPTQCETDTDDVMAQRAYFDDDEPLIELTTRSSTSTDDSLIDIL